MNDKLLSQLNKYIKDDDEFLNTNKSVNKNKEIEFSNQEIEDNFNQLDGVLVHRPPKGFVWGLGQQTRKKKCNLKKFNFR